MMWIQSEQFVQQSCPRTPMPDNEQRRVPDFRLPNALSPDEFLHVAQTCIRHTDEADDDQRMQAAEPDSETVMDQQPQPPEEVHAEPYLWANGPVSRPRLSLNAGCGGTVAHGFET